MRITDATPTLRSDDDVQLEDQVANALLATIPLKRLEGIGFLGAIDYVKKGSGRQPYRRRHNRREHSIGVAKLAETYALEVEMDERERKTIVCAALLHDVGHGPLSHTLEPVFEERFGINHHQTTRDIVEGSTRFGSQILDILREFHVEPDEVLALIEGKGNGKHAFLFSAPINIDTLEGITRCRAFVGPRSAFGSASAAVRRWAASGSLPQNDFDDFWSLKNSVYNLVINAPIGRLLDTVAQSYMTANIDKFSPEDFLKTEKSFRASHAELFTYLNVVLEYEDDLRSRLPKSWLTVDVNINDRKFFVDESVELSSLHQISTRYKQTRSRYSVKLEELVKG
ncbi:HD domain-containing protein [Paracoccaceae bacterium GXU_MW_L88]